MATKLDDVHCHPSCKRKREEETKGEQQTFNESQFPGLGLRGGNYKNFIIGFDMSITFSFWEPFLLFCPLFWAEMESSLDGVSSAQRWFLSDSKPFLDIFLLQLLQVPPIFYIFKNPCHGKKNIVHPLWNDQWCWYVIFSSEILDCNKILFRPKNMFYVFCVYYT